MSDYKFREEQYQGVFDTIEKHGTTKLGLMSNDTWCIDPKRLVFMLSRYKFVSKLVEGRQHVLEIGCADAFGSRLVRQVVPNVTVTDAESAFIDDVIAKNDPMWNLIAKTHNLIDGPVEPKNFDAVFSLDVLEHVDPKDERPFLDNLVNSMIDTGIAIIGMPSLESQEYASPASKQGHVNCKTMPKFKMLMEQYFHSVFMFSMNDEVVHTGYHKMAHYLFAVCSHKK